MLTILLNLLIAFLILYLIYWLLGKFVPPNVLQIIGIILAVIFVILVVQAFRTGGIVLM